MEDFVNRFEQRSVSAYNMKAADYENTFDGKFTARFKMTLLNVVRIQEGDCQFNHPLSV
jgi:hypothetical protein